MLYSYEEVEPLETGPSATGSSDEVMISEEEYSSNDDKDYGRRKDGEAERVVREWAGSSD